MRENIPCSPEMYQNCRVFEKQGECYQDVHHEQWPRSEYTTKVERQFRNLEVNQVFICRALHNAIHASKRSSGKPTRKEMLRAIEESRNDEN